MSQQNTPIAANTGNTTVLARPTAAVATNQAQNSSVSKPAAAPSKPAAARQEAPKAASKPAAKPAAKKAAVKKPAAKTAEPKPKAKAAPQAAKKPFAKPDKKLAAKPYVSSSAGAAFPPLYGISDIAGQPALAIPKEIQEAFSAALEESTRNIEKIFSFQSKDFAKSQKQFFSFGEDSLEQFTKSAGQTAENLNDAINDSKETIQALIESGNIAGSLTKSIGNKVAEITNSMISQQINTAQQFLTCRTASDILNLQNEFVRSSVDNAFNGTLKIAELMAQFSARVAEPLNERFADATEKFSKKLK